MDGAEEVLPFPPTASEVGEYVAAMDQRERALQQPSSAVKRPQLNTSSQAGGRYASPQISRVLQLDSARIDASLNRIIERLITGIFEVEGGGSSGGAEFDEVPRAEMPSHLLGSQVEPGFNEHDDGDMPPRRRTLLAKWTQVVSEGIPSLSRTYHDELTLLLRVALFKFTIWDKHATLGDRAQNLCFRSEFSVWLHHYRNRHAAQQLTKLSAFGCVARAVGSTLFGVSSTADLISTSEPSPLVDVPNFRPSPLLKIVYAVLSILAPYCYTRLRRLLATRQRWRYAATGVAANAHNALSTHWDGAMVALNHLEKVWMFLEYGNGLLFLAFGRFRCLLDRLLGLRLVAGRQKMIPFVAMQLMNDEITSHAWFEFLSFVGSLLSGLASRGGRLDRLLLRPARRTLGATASVMGIDAMFGFDRYHLSATSGTAAGPHVPLETLANRCALCNASPVCLPRQSASCPHVFCYFCAESALRAAGGTSLPVPRRDLAAVDVTDILGEEDSYFRCPACGVEVRQVSQCTPLHQR